MKIALFSGLHYFGTSSLGSFSLSEEVPASSLADIFLLRLVHRLNNSIKPDLVVLAGNLLPHRNADVELLALLGEYLRKLNAPCIAVPGKNDPDPEKFYSFIPRPPEHLEIDGLHFFPLLNPEKPFDGPDSETREQIRNLMERYPGPAAVIQGAPPPPRDVHTQEMRVRASEIPPVTLLLTGHPDPEESQSSRQMAELPAACACCGGSRRGSNGEGRRGGEEEGGGPVVVAAECLSEAPFRYTLLERKRNGELSLRTEQLRLPVEGLTDTHIHTCLAYCQENMDPLRTFALAKAFGLRNIAFTEHSGQLYVSSPDYWEGKLDRLGFKGCVIRRRSSDYFQLLDKWAETEKFIPGFEIDVAEDGSLLAMPEDIARIRLKVGSVHNLSETRDFEKTKQEFLFRVESLLRNSCHVLAHPFRVFLWKQFDTPRELYPDVVRLLKQYSCAAEINFHARNLPEDEFFDLCHRNGVPITLGSDSHNLYEIGEFYEHLKLLERIGVEPGELFRAPEPSSTF